MLDTFKKIFALLDEREKKRFFILIGVMLVISVAEVFGISTVLILLQVLADPARIETNWAMAWAYEALGFSSGTDFTLFLTAMVFLVVLAGLGVKALGAYALVRYSSMRGYTLSSRLLEVYLNQPYTWFLERNSSDISKTVLQEVGRLVGVILIPGLKVVSNTILAVALFAFLIAVEPIIALTASTIIGGGYALIYLRLRPLLTRYGSEMLDANTQRFRLTQEAAGGFKEVKLLGIEAHYVNRFMKPARKIASLTAFVQMMRELPRFGLEALTFGVLLGAILFLQIKNDGDLVAAVPTLGTFAFTVMRLLPAVQQIYNGISSLRNGKPLLDHVHDDYTAAKKRIVETANRKTDAERLSLHKQLDVTDAVYAYPNTERSALNSLSMSISARTTIGIVGGTGAGKTTLVDSILGLLTLQNGSISVDGATLGRDNMQAWRNCLGYVPQAIYLTDSSVAENIAFGIPPEQIDMAAVERAARAASLHEFVTCELPEGYSTMVGERGVRLSGGQRQRIGIARALYHDPEVLIMDEATSALDNLTERAVMEAVQNIRNQKTIIMIAHRLSTVRKCDCIFLLKNGAVDACGTYDELVEASEEFRAMAQAV